MGALSKKSSSALRVSVWSKNKGGGGVGAAPGPLVSPLTKTLFIILMVRNTRCPTRDTFANAKLSL